MLTNYCIVCNDKNKFRTLENDAQRISSSLKRLTASIQNSEKFNILKSSKDRYTLRSSLPHYHVMCGNCPYINDSNYNRLNYDIIDSTIILKSLYKDETQKNKISTAYRILCGYYPNLARYLEHK